MFSPKRNVRPHFSRYIKPGIYYSAGVDATPSRGKQARLAAWLDPWAVGSSKWAFAMPWLICAQRGRLISVFGELAPRHALFFVSVTENFSLAWGHTFHLHGGQKMLTFFQTPCKWKGRILFWHFSDPHKWKVWPPLQVKSANLLWYFSDPVK